MKRWLWFLAAIVISTAVYFTIRYGLRPKPIPVMNATAFEDLKQIGAVTYKRLRQEIRVERLILLGSSPESASSYEQIWDGFLRTAVADGIKVDIFFQKEGLNAPENFANWQLNPFSAASMQNGEFLEQVKTHMQAGHLVVIHGLPDEVSHLSSNSLSRQLDAATHHPVLSLSAIALSLNPSEINSLQQECLVPPIGDEGHQRLECAKSRISKMLLKKKLAANQIWSVIERHGLKEYLIFVHR